ncbi:MAG: RidA family protein [Alphaproteobacteria bacterium]|jgi:reactive intermediate/imine deaminase
MTLPIFQMIEGAPTPVAPYNHVAEADGWLFLSGQMPSDMDFAPEALPDGIEAQTHKVMANLKFILEGAGVGLENVVSARVFLTHFEDDYRRMDAVYAGYFEDGKRPARTTVGVTALASEARIEIDMIARR